MSGVIEKVSNTGEHGMKAAKKWMSAIALASLVGVSATALAFGSGGERGHRGAGFAGPFGDPGKMSRMAERLGLTDAQRDTIDETLFTARRAARPHMDGLSHARRDLGALRHADTFDEAALRVLAKVQAGHREELMVINARAFADIRAGLTPEQRDMMKKTKKRHGERRKHH
ncbi:MAG: Spy/CpxP family protein refolding chaperone [Gammaproteobacteria bacterium]|jgi:Spy/CpxP family protein refolding chaperone